MLKMRMYGLALLVVLAGCNYSNNKSTTGGPQPAEKGGKADFATVNQKVFQPYCARCHGTSGGVSLDSYAAVKANLEGIFNEVVTGQSMPPSGPLSAELRDLVATWIQNGTPETAFVDELAANGADYATINRTIFQPFCVRCHGDSGGVSLETYADVKRHLKAIRREAVKNQSMPPRRALPPELRAQLEAWIKAGAPELTLDGLSEEDNGTAL